MSLTATSQRNAVSEGTAFGLVMRYRDTLPYDKIGIDLSFTGAWRSWHYTTRFPQVSTDITKGLDGIWAMTGVDERKHSFNLYWHNNGGQWDICPRATWLDGQIDVVQAANWIDGEVPAEGWRAIAAEFLRRFEQTS